MNYPIRPKDGLTFQIKNSNAQISYQRYNKETNKFEKSDKWEKGYSQVFVFDLTNGEQIQLSKEQTSQMLLGAFVEKKLMPQLKYYVKTNGKSGIEVRYYINVVKDTQNEEEIPEFLRQSNNG